MIRALSFLLLPLVGLLLVVTLCASADAQTTQAFPTTTAPASAPSTTTVPATAPATTAAAPPPTVQSYSVTELANRAESTTVTLKRIAADLSADQIAASDERLTTLTAEIAARIEEGEKRLVPAASLDTLRTLERDWTQMRQELSEWSADLSARIAALQRDDQRLVEMAAAWQRTLEELRAPAGNTEAEIATRVQSLITQIADARSRIASRISQMRSLQGRVAAQDVRVGEALAAVRDARSRAVNRLLERDSEPVWTGHLGREAQEDVASDGRDSFARQWIATLAYAKRNPHYFAVHAIVIAVLALAAMRVRRDWGTKLEQEGGPAARSSAIFNTPIASAIVATVPLVAWLYPQAPRLLMAILVGAMFVPVILVLRRLILKPLLPLLYALGIFYVLGLAVRVTDAVPALSRGLFLITMIGGASLLAVFLWRTPRIPDYAKFAKTVHWKIIQLAVRLALILMTISAIANIFGYVGLSLLLGDGVLSSAYIAIMLDASVRVVHALLAVAMHIPPIASLGIFRRHGQLLLYRVTMLIAGAAAIWWALLTMDRFSIRSTVMENAHNILTARWGIGAINLSLGGLLAFVAAIVGSFLVSRFTRFVLTEDVYPRVHLARGVPYAVSTLLHYIILFVGFLVAVAVLCYDMTKFTILAGAFGVGLGFGMQNIVNNFVSGLILLFERPIQVGDVIELDPTTIGVVSRIGIRASVVRTGQAAEVIVPNGLLIANRVTNWTLSNRQRAFEVTVSIGPGPEPAKVIELLTSAAKQTDCVAKIPTPLVYLTELLPGGGLNFEMRVWTDRFDDWVQARSELVTAVHTVLTANAIPRL